MSVEVSSSSNPSCERRANIQKRFSMPLSLALGVVTVLGIAGAAFAGYLSSHASGEAISSSTEASQAKQTNLKGSIEAPPDPCACPAGHSCIEQPRVDFSSPSAEEFYASGRPIEVSVYACDIPSYTTTVSVTCEGVALESDQQTFSFTPQHSGVCRLRAIAGNFARGSSDAVDGKKASSIMVSKEISIQILTLHSPPEVTIIAPLGSAVLDDPTDSI